MASRRGPSGAAASRVIRPLQEFLRAEAAGGLLLVLAATTALVWVNLPFGGSYDDVWSSHVAIDLGVADLDLSLRDWVNDLLMALFFFVAGIEIKREVLRGELAGMKKASLPVMAALGGMTVPALIYTAFNAGSEGARGWGIPMATDIAFAMGVLSLLGARVSLSLKVFLLALAIADDLGAIAVIAVFYSDSLDVSWLLAAIALIGATVGCVWFGIRNVVVYAVLAMLTWLAVHESGVHATVAGVAMGLAMPVAASRSSSPSADGDRDDAAPLYRLEHTLHPWSSLLVVPLFALANAGIDLGGGVLGDAAASPIAVGVAIGLAVGKPVGIMLFAAIAVRAGIAALPENVDWREMAGVSMIAGIGFTVSIFISGLAFDDALLVDEAKIGIICGSAVAGALGFAMLWRVATADPTDALAEE